MSLSVNGASNASSYLRSLLQQQAAEHGKAAGSTDPMTALLNVFYPGRADSQPASSAAQASDSTAAMPCCGAASLSPETMAQLMSLQEQRPGSAADRVAARAQSLFGRMDANQDGQIDQTEFENVFGANADTSKVDGLFNALDADGNGAISQDELTAAAQQSHARHHHHRHMRSSGAGGPADMLMAATQGATTQTSSNADGSTTTTISYADGSQVIMTIPAASAVAGSSNDGSGAADRNAIERLIRMQAEMLTPATSGTSA